MGLKLGLLVLAEDVAPVTVGSVLERLRLSTISQIDLVLEKWRQLTTDSGLVINAITRLEYIDAGAAAV